MTSVVRDRPPSGGPPPGGPGPSRLRLILGAVLAGAVIVLPLVLLGGHGSHESDAPPLATVTAPAVAGAPRTTAKVDPLAAAKALAAKPATGPGVFDTSVGDFAGHFVGNGDSGQVDGGAVPALTNAGKALTFAIPGGGERSESVPRLPEYHEGDDVWVHDVSTLRDLPTGTGTWQLVLQWHQNGNNGSPPIALQAGGGRLRLANVGTDFQDLGALGPDDTVDVVLHIHFSRDPGAAEIDVWRDGLPKVTNYHPPKGTLLDGGDYMKVGLYRDPSISQDSSMTLNRLVVGPTDAAINATGITPR